MKCAICQEKFEDFMDLTNHLLMTHWDWLKERVGGWAIKDEWRKEEEHGEGP